MAMETQNGRMKQDDYRTFNQIVKTFKNITVLNTSVDDTENACKNIRIEPKIIYNKFSNNLKIEIKIGNSQMYQIKSLPEFYDRFLNKEYYKYGAKLEFQHTKEAFAEESQELLDYVLKYAEIIKYANESANGYEYYTKKIGEDSILISNTGIDELFNVLKNKKVEMQNEKNSEIIEFVEEKPNIQFKIREKNNLEFEMITDIDLYDYKLFDGRSYSYILLEQKLYRCTKKYKETVIELLSVLKKNFTNEVLIPKDKLANFFSIVEPYIRENIEIEEKDYKEIKQYIPKELEAKMFLDYNEHKYIIAEIKFVYGDIEINPLDLSENKGVTRNEVKESLILDMLVNSGFMLDKENNRLVLANEEKIYDFLDRDIDIYMKNMEVLVTDRFKEKEIIKTENVSIGVKVENNLLNIDFSNYNIDPEELQEIMKKYKLKKKYHRLKNGSFINLKDNANIEFIENVTKDINIDYSQIKDKTLQIPIYRAFYLEKILEKNHSVTLVKDENYKKFVDGLNQNKIEANGELPKKLMATLRTYQKVGYTWLKTLDEYGLGGILADDMGLGKTVQLLSLVCEYVENNKKRKPTLVVCPSSLALNWQNEIDKFTNEITSSVIHGTLVERQEQIKNIPNYDVIITSYELLKRDIEEYKKYNYEFKYIVADEAQYIKNNNTKNAKAIKEIISETRFALTGTPIENSLSELWSIFDFIMPGYLFSYKKFKEIYETAIVKENDEEAMGRLKQLISPFILRRIKGEVLTELPDKTITILNSQMSDEQREVYMSYLIKAKKDVKEEIEENGIERSQIKILALLTRLRQICCHPSLFINNYTGESGKLNQCIEIIKDAIEAGHKILLFSGYTSMFDIIEGKLNEEGINYLKLTGQTNVGDRINLVDRFNENDEIKLFLISLKAGGTGLNLTGADVVIHYDPWWNLSAENQATDRTYRIGQKRNVQVYKLITKDSIEEKIYDLQRRKEALIDNMLSTNQTFISKLSKEDIMKLFE